MREQLDVAEALIVEPAMNGSWSSADAILDGLANAIAETFPDESTWGTAPAARAGQATAERIFGGPAPPKATPPKVAT